MPTVSSPLLVPARPSRATRLRRAPTGARLGLAALCVATTWLVSTEARAVPPALRPGTRAHVFEFGPNFGYGFYGYYDTSLSVWNNYLYHFKGDASGPALGAALILGGWDRHMTVVTGPMFEYDFRLVPSKPLGVYLGPHVIAGYSGLVHFHDDDRWWDGRDRRNHDRHYASDHAFYSQVGMTARLILNDRWSFWMRPLNFEFRAPYFSAGWTGAFGAGVTFG